MAKGGCCVPWFKPQKYSAEIKLALIDPYFPVFSVGLFGVEVSRQGGFRHRLYLYCYSRIIEMFSSILHDDGFYSLVPVSFVAGE